jgi:steroid delta-isomerase-like uncharacterized protein
MHTRIFVKSIMSFVIILSCRSEILAGVVPDAMEDTTTTTKTKEKTTMSEKNKTLIRRYVEAIWHQGRLDQMGEYFAQDLAGHVMGESGPLTLDRETMKQRIASLRRVFPDLHLVADDEIAVDDKVVVRWTMSGTHQGEYLGMPATGRKAAWTGISIFRLNGDKIVEFWTQADAVGQMRQLGAIPAMAQG